MCKSICFDEQRRFDTDDCVKPPEKSLPDNEAAAHCV